MDNNRTIGKMIEDDHCRKEDDQNVVVTMRCTDIKSPAYGSVKVPCSECGEITWLSTSSRNIKFDKIICQQCFYKDKKYKDEECRVCVTEECINDVLISLERLGIKTTKEDMIKKMEEKIGKKLVVTELKDKKIKEVK